eukprot:s64_g30.t1
MTTNAMIIMDEIADKLEETGQQGALHYQHLQQARSVLHNCMLFPEGLIRRARHNMCAMLTDRAQWPHICWLVGWTPNQDDATFPLTHVLLKHRNAESEFAWHCFSSVAVKPRNEMVTFRLSLGARQCTSEEELEEQVDDENAGAGAGFASAVGSD